MLKVKTLLQPMTKSEDTFCFIHYKKSMILQ